VLHLPITHPPPHHTRTCIDCLCPPPLSPPRAHAAPPAQTQNTPWLPPPPFPQVALSASIQLDLGTTLLFSGLYNVASGVGFKIPMCVQVRRGGGGDTFARSRVGSSQLLWLIACSCTRQDIPLLLLNCAPPPSTITPVFVLHATTNPSPPPSLALSP